MRLVIGVGGSFDWQVAYKAPPRSRMFQELTTLNSIPSDFLIILIFIGYKFWSNNNIVILIVLRFFHGWIQGTIVY